MFNLKIGKLLDKNGNTNLKNNRKCQHVIVTINEKIFKMFNHKPLVK